MPVTIEDLTRDARRCIELARTQDVLVTDNGRVVARIGNPDADKAARLESVFGVLGDDTTTVEQAREERLGRI